MNMNKYENLERLIFHLTDAKDITDVINKKTDYLYNSFRNGNKDLQDIIEYDKERLRYLTDIEEASRTFFSIQQGILSLEQQKVERADELLINKLQELKLFNKNYEYEEDELLILQEQYQLNLKNLKIEKEKSLQNLNNLKIKEQ